MSSLSPLDSPDNVKCPVPDAPARADARTHCSYKIALHYLRILCRVCSPTLPIQVYNWMLAWLCSQLAWFTRDLVANCVDELCCPFDFSVDGCRVYKMLIYVRLWALLLSFDDWDIDFVARTLPWPDIHFVFSIKIQWFSISTYNKKNCSSRNLWQAKFLFDLYINWYCLFHGHTSPDHCNLMRQRIYTLICENKLIMWFFLVCTRSFSPGWSCQMVFGLWPQHKFYREKSTVWKIVDAHNDTNTHIEQPQVTECYHSVIVYSTQNQLHSVYCMGAPVKHSLRLN